MYLCMYVCVSISWFSVVLHGFQDTYQYSLTLCKPFFSATNRNANCPVDSDFEIPAPPLASLPSPLRWKAWGSGLSCVQRRA